MLPITFDRHVLHSLPALDDAAAARVIHLLHTIAVRRVVPHLAAREDSDAMLLARAADRTAIARLEDAEGRLDLVSLLTSEKGRWAIQIHERIFDYFAFAFPGGERAPEQLTAEARRAFALAEFILRHQFHHITFPDHSEEDVIVADLAFVRAARQRDEAFATSLLEALTDETIGLRASGYLELLERDGEVADEEDYSATRARIGELLGEHVCFLCDAPAPLLQRVFTAQGPEERRELVMACLEQGGNPDLPVTRRSEHYRGALALLDAQRAEDEDGLRRLLGFLRERGADGAVLQEMELASDEDPLSAEPAWHRFVHALRTQVAQVGVTGDTVARRRHDGTAAHSSSTGEATLEGPVLTGETPRLTLKERIERARKDPRVPEAVLGTIDANQSNLEGHSKAKYTEFIETLLAVPWGRLNRLEVGPREFSLGLEHSHFGLERAKELVGDFFANLLWRYRDFDPQESSDWHRTGSAFLFVGPPGVGKTSLAISIAKTLGIPYHKVSLGGMRDESALRGHGFTYEGSKPGAIVQGLIKMDTMNGMFILDEADKTEPFAIATLLEILDPEQNHLFHDKFTMSTVDIDLSNCHFILTANTLETVPAPVLDRCQVVELGRYSVEEKVIIARRHLLPRLRAKHEIPESQVVFEPGFEDEHLRMIVRAYTLEAGVRQLELVLRTLLLRVQRRKVFEAGEDRVVLDHNLICDMLDTPVPPRTVQPEDLIGEVAALGVNPELGIGSLLPVQVTPIPGPGADGGGTVSVLHATGNLEKVMDESRKVATTAILHNADRLGVDPDRLKTPFHLHVMGSSSKKDGPSAGIAIALALTSQLTGQPVRRDVAATGEIGTRGRITGVGGLDVKLETAVHAGCKTLVIPRENLVGPAGIAGLPEALKRELQVLDFAEWRENRRSMDYEHQLLRVVAVGHLTEAWEVARLDTAALDEVEQRVVEHAEQFAQHAISDRPCPPNVVVKDDGELAGFGSPALCAGCPGCHLLVPSGSELPASVADRAQQIHYAPGGSGLARQLESTVSDQLRSGERPVVVAPYFVLRDAGLVDRQDVVAVASNWLTDGRKLSSGRDLVHRVSCRLLRNGRETLEGFPLFRRQDGVYAITLDAVPEECRLDLGRCEELVRRFLSRWLEVAVG